MVPFDIFNISERLMSMNRATWARHANPWSVYSRIVGGSFVFAALWSPFWIGYWGIPAILLAALWVRLNPRMFPAPTHTDGWATQAVLGERAFLNRAQVPIPRHHAVAAYVTSALAGLFLLIVVAAFLTRDFWLALTAWHAATIAKLWFCDRMTWLWADMKTATAKYRAWTSAEW
ncbi:DUF6653 family protein [Jannaschia donghaensis]|uniref:Uncharacterized protein n=1 Tax=Jannaschia donghaensis TaxID=420998 RepID=A0A0M6YNJ7_9RHOB|nr:DUF6653 family protein [Jannaschia donghaensis]CTQ51454.1 hypothetical protein JDO7802_03494 [Jannaschia donghaensis]